MASLTPTPPTHPAVQRAMLVRERLIDRLRARWFVPVIVVSAPAGYGKTTLLTQAIAANAAAPVGIDYWVACGPGLGAASALGQKLCRAVEAAPAASRAIDTIDTIDGGDAGPDEVAALATRVADAMWRRSPQPVALVLDDVHEIPPGSEAARLLDAVVASLPANGHVVLAGRGEPPLRLARLEVQGRVAHVRQADMAFTEDEVAEFAALRGASNPKVAACGGWPALAELFASARPGAAAEYVGEEVLAPLPAERRRAVALLAHLGPFDDEVARAVLGADVDVAGLLSDLPLATRGPGSDGRWRLHSLWQSLVAADVTPGEVAEARRRAGAALRWRGRAGAAVQAFIDAGAWDDFTSAIAEALGVAHPPVARDVLAEWFTQLPPQIRTEPGGRLLAGVLAVDSDPAGARRMLADCAEAFRSLDHTAGEIACLVQLGHMAWWSKDPDALPAVVARVFELEAAGCEEVVPIACLGRALLHDIGNDSRSMLGELDRIVPGSINDAWRGLVSWARAIGLLELGHTPEALEAAEDALAHAELLHAPLAQTTRLQALWYGGRSAEVHEALPALLERIKQSGYRHHTALVAAQCSVVHALGGRDEPAAACLAEGKAAAVAASDVPLIDTNLAVAEAAVALASGDEERAAAVLASHLAAYPVRQGVTAAPQQRHLALFYVLVPSTRPVWDDADLGPAWAFGRDLARAVVAVRDGRPLPRTTPPLREPALVQAHLPPVWVAELAVAAIAAGRDDGWDLLDATWTVTRPTVVDLADGPGPGAEGPAADGPGPDGPGTDGPGADGGAEGSGDGGASPEAATARRSGPDVSRAARDALGRLAALPTSRLELRLLGPVELLDDDVPVEASHWRRRRVRSLLAHLALHRTVARGQLAEDLWPELDPEAKSRNLRVTLSYLLRVLEPDRGQRDASFFVRQHGDNVSLHPGEWLSVDLWAFDTHCAQATEADRHGAPAEALDHGLRAVELWRGEPTELASEQWAIASLEQRRLRFAAVATRTGELLLAHGDGEEAQTLVERALTIDPWREAAHRLLVATHLSRGDDLAARRALRRYRDAIDELGIDAGEATLMVERLVDTLPASTTRS